MVTELLDLASRIQQTSHVFREHQETMETEVMETLHEYSGVINTFPGLVRLHEEAMEYYNNSKNKDSVGLTNHTHLTTHPPTHTQTHAHTIVEKGSRRGQTEL